MANGVTIGLLNDRVDGANPDDRPKSRRRRRQGDGKALRQLARIFRTIGRWASRHSNRVKKCYLAAGPERLGLYVVPVSEAYDFELTRLLAELSADLSDAGDPIRVFQVPEGPGDELTVFFDDSMGPVFSLSLD